jgi:hypothetical protein
VSSSTIKDRSLTARDLRGASCGRDPGARTGPKGDMSPQGVRGLQGEPGPFPGGLPSGETIRGTYDIEDDAPDADGIASNSISFGFTLDSAPTPHTIPARQGPSKECPGSVSSPEAAPGHLCIYEQASTNKSTGGSLYPRALNPVTNLSGASRFGANLYITSAAAGYFYSIGTWAVTSP